MVTLDQLRRRLDANNQRRALYEWKAQQPGRLRRHEAWRHRYLSSPYMIGAPDDRVAERFRNIFLNVSELGPNGKVRPVPLHETDEFMEVFTHMLEEYETRSGGIPGPLIEAARQPFLKYFEHGTPIGVAMFEGYKAPSGPILVKYGKRVFLEPMFTAGQIRLANAKSYRNASYLNSVRDDETSRTFFIPTFRERIEGKTSVTIDGRKLDFGDDDLVLPLEFDDYYLFSLCEHIHYRMPTDFDANAAIVIRDPELFKQRLIATFLARFPNWTPFEGRVVYYDPYRDYTKFRVPEMAKHFAYAYQKEVRIAFRPRRPNSSDLDPVFLSIGSMEAYADLVTI